MAIGERISYGDTTVDRVPGGWLYSIQRIGQTQVQNPQNPKGPPVVVPFGITCTTTFVSDLE